MAYKLSNKKTRVIFTEKFHGKKLKGKFMQEYKNEKEARDTVRSWNSITPKDQMDVKEVFVETKYNGIFQKR